MTAGCARVSLVCAAARTLPPAGVPHSWRSGRLLEFRLACGPP